MSGLKKFPFYKQLDAMDCGPASLKIIARFYGKNYSMKYLRDHCNSTREGVSLADLCATAEQIGLRTLPLKVSLEDLQKKIPLPCIVHWNHSHFIVVYKISRKKIYVSDPQAGLLSYSPEEFAKGWKKSEEKGVVLALEPSPEFHEKQDVETEWSIRNYLPYLKPHKRLLTQVFFGMIFGVLLSLIFPFITQSIVDIGIETQDFDFIHILLIASLVLTLSSVFSDYIQNRMMLYISDRINISMVSDFIQKTLRLPVSFFERKMTSDILNRVRDHDRIQEFIFSALLHTLVAVLSFVVYAIILVYYSPTLFVFFLVGTVLYIAWIFLFLKRRRTLDFKYFDSQITNQNEIFQISENSLEIKANNLERKKRWDWEKSRLDIYNLHIKMLNLSQAQNMGTSILDRLKNVFITFYAAKFVIDGDMTLGMMLSVQYIIGQMNGPVGKMIYFIQSFQDAKMSLERVGEVVHEEKEESLFTGIEMPIPARKHITLQEVSFRYHPNSPLILDQINLHIPEGKMTAIVGQSGSGKTTLMKLLLRLYTDYEGEITVGPTDLQSIHLQKWRDRCGAVLQEGKILNDTLLQNIVLDVEKVDTERLSQVIRLANLTSFVEQCPQHLYTPMGQGGMGISGGQKQRILIARALYKNPDFLFFDEATNSLDTKNENEITRHLNSFIKGKTSVVIAHRLSTVKSADQIIVLDKGKVVETGTHEELLLRGGYYYNLIGNQLELQA